MSGVLLAIVTFLYTGTAVAYLSEGRPPMMLVFIGYSLANVGLIWDGLR